MRVICFLFYYSEDTFIYYIISYIFKQKNKLWCDIVNGVLNCVYRIHYEYKYMLDTEYKSTDHPHFNNNNNNNFKSNYNIHLF